MTLRGALSSFPLETIVQLIAATAKTGQLEVRSRSESGTLGFAEGRLVSAQSGDDSGYAALGAVFALADGEFEFVPWGDPPPANLSGDLNQLLDRAVVQRDKIIADRELIPDDRMRFVLSDRAAAEGEVRLSAEQWRTLLAVGSDRDLTAIAGQLKLGRLAALSVLADLVRSGIVATVLPPPEPPPAPKGGPRGSGAPARAPWERSPEPPARAEWEAPAEPPARTAAPVIEPPPRASTEPPPRASWETPAPPAERRVPAAPAEPPARSSWESPASSARTWEEPAPEARSWEPPAEVEELDTAVESKDSDIDARLAALSGAFGGEPAGTVWEPARPELKPVPAPEPAPPPEPRAAAPAAEPAVAEQAIEEPKKRGGLFSGLFKKDESATPAAPPSGAADPSQNGGRVTQLAALANGLLDEYKSPEYGKGRIDDRIASLLMHVDEQADPIDRPLPVAKDRIDVEALERSGMSDAQLAPYLALLVSQIFADAERAFGRDKARRGYKSVQQSVAGDAASLGTDLRLPRA